MPRLTVVAMRARSGAQVQTPAAKAVARVRQPAAVTEVPLAPLADSVRAVVMTVVEARRVIASVAQPALFVPETLTGMELLEQFRVRGGRLVFVVDEYGVVQGLMTPLDLLEAITGELSPERPVDAWATRQDDGSWRVDGAMPVAELKARLDIDELPDEDKGRYNTVAGLMQTVAGQLLAQGEHVDSAGWRFEVLKLEGRRIDQVLIRVLPASEDH